VSKIHLATRNNRETTGYAHRNVTSGWVKMLRIVYWDMRRHGIPARKARSWIYYSLIAGQNSPTERATLPKQAVGAF
jgi:hypothetical protein